eukprot:scaffold124841_cov16-Prasinocladus_malaysianus.AAC.2
MVVLWICWLVMPSFVVTTAAVAVMAVARMPVRCYCCCCGKDYCPWHYCQLRPGSPRQFAAAAAAAAAV